MNENEFQIILPEIIACVESKLMDKYGWTEDFTIRRFINSKTYAYLENESTKIWQYSADMIVRLFEDERCGNFSFPEV